MKKSELLHIIKEEIKDAFEKNSPKAKYKKGDKINYLGNQYTVLSDNGYVITGVDSRGREKTVNHSQLKQGMVVSVKEELKEKKYYFTYTYINKEGDKDNDEIVVTASNEEEARKKAKKEIKISILKLTLNKTV